MSKQPAVYILANRERGTLYVGVTGNLKLRIWEHREGLVAGFTSKYGVKRLVRYEWSRISPRQFFAKSSSRSGIVHGSWS